MKTILVLALMISVVPTLSFASCKKMGGDRRKAAQYRYSPGHCQSNEVVFMGMCVSKKDSSRR